MMKIVRCQKRSTSRKMNKMKTLKQIEKEHIIFALKHSKGLARTAKELGIARCSLYRKCKEYKIKYEIKRDMRVITKVEVILK